MAPMKVKEASTGAGNSIALHADDRYPVSLTVKRIAPVVHSVSFTSSEVRMGSTNGVGFIPLRDTVPNRPELMD